MSNVTHPKHYNQGKIEVIEAIEDWGVNFHRGNAIKYVARAGKKDPSKEIEDLEKAIWYLEREKELLSAKREGRDIVKPHDMNKRVSLSKRFDAFIVGKDYNEGTNVLELRIVVGSSRESHKELSDYLDIGMVDGTKLLCLPEAKEK